MVEASTCAHDPRGIKKTKVHAANFSDGSESSCPFAVQYSVVTFCCLTNEKSFTVQICALGTSKARKHIVLLRPEKTCYFGRKLRHEKKLKTTDEE